MVWPKQGVSTELICINVMQALGLKISVDKTEQQPSMSPFNIQMVQAKHAQAFSTEIVALMDVSIMH